MNSDSSPSSPGIGLGRLDRVPIREIWPHEAHDFTPWLSENVDRLSDALGIDISIEGIEHKVGDFSLDVIGHDLTHDKPLIIENQLAQSDHTHLGQLVTYAAGTNAGTIIWLASSIREEHRQALQWLNENTGQMLHFFGVELEAVRIGDSVPAPLFSVVVSPNEWQKQVREATTTLSGRQLLYLEFWRQFKHRLDAERPSWTKAKSAPAKNWFRMSSGVPSRYEINSVLLRNNQAHVEIYFKFPTAKANETAFDSLLEQRETFESAFGGPVSWDRLETRKTCRISILGNGNLEDPDSHDDIIKFFMDGGDRMRLALMAVDLA